MGIKVFVVDGSAVNRAFLRKLFSHAHGFELLGVASTPLLAIKRLHGKAVDLVICSYDVPGMTGMEYLHYLQRNSAPQFILLLPPDSAASIAQHALQTGAAACISRPNLHNQQLADQFGLDLLAAANNNRLRLKSLQTSTKLKQAQRFDVIAIGSSTGGIAIIEKLLSQLGPQSPCVLIVQHMPERFTHSFAERLNKLVDIEVKEAVDGELLRPGLALIAAGGKHLSVQQRGQQLYTHVFHGEQQHHHRPSVDVLFSSLASCKSLAVYALLLTGMGKDGAEGMLALKTQQAVTVTLSEKDCVVYGMPRAAQQLGAALYEKDVKQLLADFASFKK